MTITTQQTPPTPRGDASAEVARRRRRTAGVLQRIRDLTHPEPGCSSCARQQRVCRRHFEERLK